MAHVHTFRDSWLHILLLGGIGFILFVIWFGILQGGVAVDAGILEISARINLQTAGPQ